jgi:predicted RNase H-like nuclease (RuvC/YqgF family)
MKILLFLTVTFSLSSYGQSGNSLYLSDKDQPYFKNGANDGSNQFERIEKNVAEINKLHGEIRSLKDQIETMKKEIQELKNRR